MKKYQEKAALIQEEKKQKLILKIEKEFDEKLNKWREQQK